jgi:signal transduction histidine kinase
MASRLQSNVNELRAFVANASHELRTPLTVVKLRAEALQDGAMEDPQISKRFMGEIEHEVDRLVRMVNDLLDLSRMEAGMDAERPSLINISTIAEEVYETFEIRAERAGVSLECDIEEDLPQVLGNEDQIRRVLYNLLDNAIKYSSAGCKVSLSINSVPEDHSVRIAVQDSGPGIAPEHLPHVFERFYRVETTPARSGSIRGSGLGLAIAKSIVESHGGEIGVKSELDSGTVFWASLPAHE